MVGKECVCAFGGEVALERGRLGSQKVHDYQPIEDVRKLSVHGKAQELATEFQVLAQQHGQTDLDRRSALVKATEKTVFDLVNAGGRVTAGTDAAINPYGISLLMEIEQYVDGGVTPLQALRTATTNSAAALGLAADLGAIAPGRLADLVVLDGNPLANIRDLRKVKAVVKDGEAFTEAELLKKPQR